MAQEPSEYRLAVETLKRRLRANKITYRELAQGIGLSESGVKKILSASDGSFSRLARMCAFVGLTLAELLNESDQDLVDVTFSDRQQEAFLADPQLFHFYWQLVYERKPLEEIETLWGLSSKESFRRLRQLDILGTIQLMPGNRVRIPSIKRIRWVGDGPLIRKLYQEWSQNLIRTLAQPDPGPNRLFLIRYLQLTPKTYRELLEAQRQLEIEFFGRAIREMRLRPKGLHHVRWVAGIDAESFVPDPPRVGRNMRRT